MLRSFTRSMTMLGARQLDSWLWVCPLITLALAAGVLWAWGWSIWTALLVALFLVCPSIIVWELVSELYARRRHKRGAR